MTQPDPSPEQTCPFQWPGPGGSFCVRELGHDGAHQPPDRNVDGVYLNRQVPHVGALLAEVDLLRSIVRDLAVCGPIIPTDPAYDLWECGCCHETELAEREFTEHAEGCVWRRAVAWVAEHAASEGAG